jgi:hypothetical protein
MPRAKTPAPPQNVLNLMKQRFVIDEEGVISNLDTNPNKVHEKANCNGYIRIWVCGKPYYAHHLAWLLYYGEWPETQIDHEDRNRINNLKDNLRFAKHSENSQNKALQSNNTSGHKGIRQMPSGKWRAVIDANTLIYRLGTYATMEEAVAIYKLASRFLHGMFSRVS